MMLAPEMLHAEEESRARRRQELERVLGATITEALGRSDVVEVMVNPDGRIFVDSLVDGTVESEARITPAEAEDLCVTIASELGKTIDAEHPSLIGELPIDGSRVQGIFPPNATAPVLTIRKKASRVIPLEEYVERGILAGNHYDMLRQAAAERRNVVFVGGTGSGKTTLGNAFLRTIAELAPKDRVVTLEDTYELQVTSENVVPLRTSESCSMTQLVKVALRLRPDRIVVGECRDESAFDFFMALNTGHKGSFTTIHANDAPDALARFESLILLADKPVIPAMLARAIHLIACMQRDRGVFRVTELARLTGVSATGAYELETIDPIWGDLAA